MKQKQYLQFLVRVIRRPGYMNKAFIACFDPRSMTRKEVREKLICLLIPIQHVKNLIQFGNCSPYPYEEKNHLESTVHWFFKQIEIGEPLTLDGRNSYIIVNGAEEAKINRIIKEGKNDRYDVTVNWEACPFEERLPDDTGYEDRDE